MNEIVTRIIQDGDRRIVEIPSSFPAHGDVTIRQQGDALIIEPVVSAPVKPTSWAAFLDGLEPVDVEWPDVDEGLLPVEAVDLLT